MTDEEFGGKNMSEIKRGRISKEYLENEGEMFIEIIEDVTRVIMRNNQGKDKKDNTYARVFFGLIGGNNYRNDRYFMKIAISDGKSENAIVAKAQMENELKKHFTEPYFKVVNTKWSSDQADFYNGYDSHYIYIHMYHCDDITQERLFELVPDKTTYEMLKDTLEEEILYWGKSDER